MMTRALGTDGKTPSVYGSSKFQDWLRHSGAKRPNPLNLFPNEDSAGIVIYSAIENALLYVDLVNWFSAVTFSTTTTLSIYVYTYYATELYNCWQDGLITTAQYTAASIAQLHVTAICGKVAAESADCCKSPEHFWQIS